MRAASVSDNGAAEEKKMVATVSGVVIRNKNYEQCTQPTERTVKTKINTHTRQFEKIYQHMPGNINHTKQVLVCILEE